MPSATTKSKLEVTEAIKHTNKVKAKKVSEKSKPSMKTKEVKEKKVSAKSKPTMKAKEAPPKKKASQAADKQARVALATGDLSKDETTRERLQDEGTRKKEQDSRTLYLRFDKSSTPTSAEEIKALHSDIKFVRTPRMAVKGDNAVRYAFVEFGSSEECKAAHKKLATTQFAGKEVVVDFVGENSKNQRGKGEKGEKESCRLNPTRLFICGLAPGVTKTNLKEMFPKAGHADIPARSKKKGTSYGFVQFSSPGDAKAAFDAAKNLTIADHKITVLFAKVSEMKEEVVQKKKEKKLAREEKKKNEKKEGQQEEVKEEEVASPKKAEKRKGPKDEVVEVKKAKEEEENDEDSEDENDEESDDEDAEDEGEEKAGGEDNDEDDDEDGSGEENEAEGAKQEAGDEEDDDDDDDDE